MAPRSGAVTHLDPNTCYGSLLSHVVAGTAVSVPPQRGVVEGVDHLAYDQLRFTRNLDDSAPVDEGAVVETWSRCPLLVRTDRVERWLRRRGLGGRSRGHGLSAV